MDISSSVQIAAEHYRGVPNLYFVQGDIAQTHFEDESIDYLSCDQVLHHTQDPSKTVEEFCRITKTNEEMALYVYRKKALPRELLDDYFRSECKKHSYEEITELSTQLAGLGKTLTVLDIEIEVPDMPLLGIAGGKYDLQRFIYWNFIKCYWNKDQGESMSISTNVDWYTPSLAFRYSKEEFLNIIHENDLETVSFHEEEAAYSGRFRKIKEFG